MSPTVPEWPNLDDVMTWKCFLHHWPLRDPTDHRWKNPHKDLHTELVSRPLTDLYNRQLRERYATCLFATTRAIIMTTKRAQYNNTERHTAHTIVSWPNPKQWIIVHTSDLMMIIRQSIYILSIITGEMGQPKTHSPAYFVMDNWENMPYLTHTLDKLYLTGILWVQCLQISLHNDDNEMVQCTNKRIRSSSQTYLTICTHHKLHNDNENKFPVFPECICNK